ncbi:hypothetical protein CALVIDRAFT_563227 [Calocera viscosa TUFC12733]|uniref:Uncharacterized protein n=1 Tax=Calocera viscosa (strain TUFC12733) TaxID=1330018 RepID=A0A167MRV3_CALVF|nr:hypothetical protein CALVIDRAFT_563227 [Calocera viscosa TUFC12733]
MQADDDVLCRRRPARSLLLDGLFEGLNGDAAWLTLFVDEAFIESWGIEEQVTPTADPPA